MAAKLDPTAWKFISWETNSQSGLPRVTDEGIGYVEAGSGTSDPSSAMKVLTDNSLSTCLTNLRIGIDFGGTNTIDRVYLTGTNRQLQFWPHWQQTGTNPPPGLVTISVGGVWPPTNRVGSFTVPYDAGNPVDTEVDIRFNPTAGRYVLIQLQTNAIWGVNYWPGYALKSQPSAPTNLTWRVAELEIHGFNGTFPHSDAVVLSAPAPEPLTLAANELSYYLGELAGRPVPIITPAATNNYPGVLYCINDLKPLAPDYGTMMSNISAGLLPDNVNIQICGRQVMFTAWPYRCVLWSVWEFLERQGVRWLYPDAQGDYVPCGKGIDLSFLPLHYTPAATSIYANWNTSSLEPWPQRGLQSIRQSYLYPWRNRWNYSWNGYGPLGGGEIPAAPAPGMLSAEYKEKFDGYPHNFKSVVPNRILLSMGTNWWGYDSALGGRVSPTNENITFCMDNPDLIQWVANKVIAVDAAYPVSSQHPLNIFHANAGYNLLPMDVTRFCQDTQWCGPANGPSVPAGHAYVSISSQSMSGEYYTFVNSVAQAVRDRGSKALVGALAYADVYEPPANISTFPDNVQVEVCMFGAPNLPVTSRRNADLKAAWEAWHSKCSHLATYDYALLHTDYWQQDPRMPVPLVTAIIDLAKYLDQIGALNGGCQATLSSLPYNPWNFYAYPRIRWNTKQSSKAMLQEFFAGYFGECAAPMLAYYQTFENYEITNNVNLHYRGYCYGITPGSFPLSLLDQMQSSLRVAEQSATNWAVIDRVGKVRDGFNWVIAQRNLTGINLADSSSYPKVPTNGTFTVNLARMVAPASRPFGNYVSPLKDLWFFHAHGTIQTTLDFQRGGTYQVTVRARAVPFQNVYPVLNCYLGASEGSATISSTNFEEYSFTQTVPSGGWDLVLNYLNDAPGGARNIYLNQIQITPQSWH
jgi:hypothetical protein